MEAASVVWMLVRWLEPASSPVGLTAPAIPAIVPVREALVQVLQHLGRKDLVARVDRHDDIVEHALITPWAQESWTITVDIFNALIAWMRELRTRATEAEVPVGADQSLLRPLGRLCEAMGLFSVQIQLAGMGAGDSAAARSADGIGIPQAGEFLLAGDFDVDGQRYEARVELDNSVTVTAEAEPGLRRGTSERLGEWDWIRNEVSTARIGGEHPESLARAATMALGALALKLREMMYHSTQTCQRG